MRRLLLGFLSGLAATLSVAQAEDKNTEARPAEPVQVRAVDANKPWTREDRALVLDAYEYNELDWAAIGTNKRIAGFINKASDGLPPTYVCNSKAVESEYRLCRALWFRHSVARELYQTRRQMAKAMGLKWGAYHLARPGNPVQQAQNFLDFAKPTSDELMALDIEDNDPTRWMSLEDAEIFVQVIRERTGRYPVLYTNGSTAQYIGDNAHRFKLLSRLPLWYARYKPEVAMHFPKGNWDTYALWQFVSQTNCNRRACPMRIAGTNRDIDINVADMTVEELRAAWPFDRLLPARESDILVAETVPVPFPRELALAGRVEMRMASVEMPVPGWSERVYAFATSSLDVIATAYLSATEVHAGQAAIASMAGPAGATGHAADVDAITTASIAPPEAAVAATAPEVTGPDVVRRADLPAMMFAPLTGGGEKFEDLFGRASHHGAATGNEDRPLNQHRKLQHEIDKLLVAPFFVGKAEIIKGRVRASQ